MRGQSLPGNWQHQTCIAQGSALKFSSLVINVQEGGIFFKCKQVAWEARSGLGLTSWWVGMHKQHSEVGVEEFVKVLRTEFGVHQTITQVAQRRETDGDKRQK